MNGDHITLRRFCAGAVALGLTACFFTQGYHFIRANSQTFDEAAHLTAGYSYWATGDFRLNSEHPPFVKLLCALPGFVRYSLPFSPDSTDWASAAQGQDPPQWRISSTFLYGGGVDAEEILDCGRLPNLALGCVLVLLVGWWSYRLHGLGGACLGMALAAFEPNLIAHASLVTTDLAMAIFTLLTLYLCWEYWQKPSAKLLTCTGLAVGLALGTKFSSILLLAIVAVAVAVHICIDSLSKPHGEAGIRTGQRLAARTGHGLAFVIRITVIGIAVVVVLYGCQLQNVHWWFHGLKTQINQQASEKECFLLGEFSTSGWWYYFPLAYIIKTPLGSITLIALAGLLWRLGRQSPRPTLVFLALPIVLYAVALMRLRLNIGLRYALPIMPLLFVVASRLATVRLGPAWLMPGITLACVSWSAHASVQIGPHHLTYFNEITGGPTNGPRYLADSNLDWGQGLRGLRKRLKEECASRVYLSYYGTASPAAVGVPHVWLPGFGQFDMLRQETPEAVSGREFLAISITNLQGLHFADKKLFGWLHERSPLAKIGNCMYVYEITNDSEAHRRLADVYRQVGDSVSHLRELEIAKGILQKVSRRNTRVDR